MPTIRHLVERGGSFHARLSVPHTLRSIVGKTELWAALSATDRRDANRKLPAALARLHAVIEAARAEAKAARIQMRAPRPDQLLAPRQIALAHYSRELELDNQGRNFGGYDVAWRETSAPIYTDKLRRVASGSAPDNEANAVIGWAIDVFARNGNVKAEYGSTEWRALARQLAAIQLEIEKQKDARDRGESGPSPTHTLLINQPEPTAAKNDPLAARILNGDSTKTLNEILPDFIKERKPSEKSAADYRLTIRLFEEVLGEDKPVYRITRADVIAFKRALQDLPANHTKRFPGRTVPQAIKENKGRADPFKPLHSKTINNKYLSALRSLLNWCWNNGIFPDNQAAGIRVEETKSTEPDRLPFAPGDLAKIFAPERFAKRPFNETQWALLISLFGGMRASELAQIKLDSVRHERGALVFVIEERTKNVSTRRLVPVHSALMALGLSDRIDSLRASGETHLFPDWYKKGEASRNWEAYIPKAFNVTTKKKLAIVGRKVWHSFRHTFKTGLARAGVDRSTRDLLCGHADNSAGGVYVHDVSVEAMKAAIEKLHFDGFTLAS